MEAKTGLLRRKSRGTSVGLPSTRAGRDPASVRAQRRGSRTWARLGPTRRIAGRGLRSGRGSPRANAGASGAVQGNSNAVPPPRCRLGRLLDGGRPRVVNQSCAGSDPAPRERVAKRCCSCEHLNECASSMGLDDLQRDTRYRQPTSGSAQQRGRASDLRTAPLRRCEARPHAVDAITQRVTE